MATRLRISPFLRRAAVTAAFGALLVPAATGAAPAQAAAKKKVKLPVVTGVKPMNVAVGEVLEIRGRNFVRGRNRNTVVFKRDGGKAVFIKASVGTAKLLKVTIPAKLEKSFAVSGGVPKPTRFRLRILSKKFGKAFTRTGLSPTVSAQRPPTPPGFVQTQPDGDCDGDGAKNKVDADDDNDGLSDAIEESLNLNPCLTDTDGDGLIDRWEYDCDRNGLLNRDETDDDKDLLSDTVENQIGTDSCIGDTDGDGVEDGYEQRSAYDLNDDEHQEINEILLYPGKLPYPNALDPSDGTTDYDGDSLTLVEEYRLWVYTINTWASPRSLEALTYSDGEQYTFSARGADGRRTPTLAASGYNRQVQFLDWAASAGYDQVMVSDVDEMWYEPRTSYDIRDFNRSGGLSTVPDTATPTVAPHYENSELYYYDHVEDGWLTDAERDEDADGLTNFDEAHGCMMDHSYWAQLYSAETPYPVKYKGTKLDDEDTDGDGVRDGADDQDHDDLPNLMECSRNAASGRPFDDPTNPPTTADPTPQEGHIAPFSPCLPSRYSRTCNQFPSLDQPWAPFNGDDKYYYVFN